MGTTENPKTYRENNCTGPWGIQEWTAPRGRAANGRLIFPAGVRAAEICAEKNMTGLVHGRFESRVDWVGFEDGVVMIGFRRSRLTMGMAERQAKDYIRLNEAVPWEIEFRKRAAQVTVNLLNARLRSLDLLGGAGQLQVELPRPSGAAYIYLAGGVEHVILHRPEGVGVSLSAQGGVDRLTLDRIRYGRIYGETRLRSAKPADKCGWYEISIIVGAGQVDILD